METIRAASTYAISNQDEFLKKVRAASELRQEAAVKDTKCKLNKKRKRADELDVIIKKLYESFAIGRISDERFDSLLAEYEAEQKELQGSVADAEQRLSAFEEDTARVEQFMELAKRYTDFSELTTPMINEFIDKIIVHAPEKVDGDRVQEVEIYLNFIGKYELPAVELSEEEIKREEFLKKERARSRERYRKLKSGERAVGVPITQTCKCCGKTFEARSTAKLFCDVNCKARYYRQEAKVVNRGTGRSAVAASAYLSCSKIVNDYDGVQHDYTRKKGLVWQQVFLPEYAPKEWQDRSLLWNAVEGNEKTKDSRLAREFVVALPIELNESQWEKLLSDFISDTFVTDGMCADVAIHDSDPPGHNPHAHIMLTVRPLDEKGKWQYKTEKEYLCVKDSEERDFTAAEFKQAQVDGWEKQYQYKVGKKKVYMTPSAAQTQGYERVSKYPKSTKYGRQNPISERWNSEEQLVLWRKAWADVLNLHLEKASRAERIDHRSHAERGLEEQPTIYEGVVARALEKRVSYLTGVS